MSDNRICVVHEVQPGDGLTVCCGRSLFELPMTDRATNDPRQRTCHGADQSGAVSRVDLSSLGGGGDPSSGVVELPDDAVEAGPMTAKENIGTLRLLAVLNTLPGKQDEQTELLNVLCAAVRAEAVADERVGVVAELEAAGLLEAANLVARCAGSSVADRIAGSVPVATPEPCGWWDGPEDHVYGICNRSKGHQGRHAETLADGTHWAGWGGGSRPPAPATRGSATDPWVATPAEPERCPACFAAVPGPLPLGWVCGNDFHGPYRAASPVPAEQPPTFEQLLTDPLEQFDTRSELLPAILHYFGLPDATNARTALLRSIEEYRNAPPATASTSHLTRPAEQPEER